MILGAIALLAVATTPAYAEQDSLERTRRMVDQFNARFVRIGPALAENLDQLYTEDVRFRDPISTVTGLVDLRRYFERFAELSAGAHFEIGDTIVQPGQAAIFWTMVMVDKDGSEARRFQGVSHLKVSDRIYEERDYFDLGDAVYDHVPVVGWLTRFVRSRLD
jgi:limonene-1,2-epoxide hydrolase